MATETVSESRTVSANRSVFHEVMTETWWLTFLGPPCTVCGMFCEQLKEQEIKRQFQDAAKIQQKQFKVYRNHQLAKTSKGEQKELMKRMKEEQLRRMAMLSQQYDASIAEMIERQNVILYYSCLSVYFFLV